jgi:hypothetical protein
LGLRVLLGIVAFRQRHCSKIHCHNQSPDLKDPVTVKTVAGFAPTIPLIAVLISLRTFGSLAAMGAKTPKRKTPWRCPKCGREFAQRSAYHGCGKFTIEGYLAGKNPAGVALFNLLAEAAQKFPSVTVSPAKTQITFRVRANFLMVSVSGCGIQGYIFLPAATPRPYFKKIVAASSRRYAHVFRINEAAILQDDFVKLLPEAVALVSEEDDVERPESPTRKVSIGEEINALYRADRASASGLARQR